MNQHVFIVTPEDNDVEIRVGRRPRRQCRRCRHLTRPRGSHTGSTADLGVELDIEVLPEEGRRQQARPQYKLKEKLTV